MSFPSSCHVSSQVVFDLVLSHTHANIGSEIRIVLHAGLLTVSRVKRKSKKLPTSATKCSVYKNTFEAYKNQYFE